MAKIKNVVYITGGTRGLGASLSEVFAEQGYDVHSLYRSSDPQSWLSPLQAKGYSINTEAFDITKKNYSFPKEFSGDTLTVIHNACASFKPSPFHLLSTISFTEQFEVGLIGLCNIVLPTLKLAKQFKEVKIGVVLTDALNIKPVPKGFSHYLPIKAAMEQFIKGLAVEYSGRNISFHLFYPPAMETDLIKDWHPAFKESAASPENQPRAVALKIFDEIKSS